MKIINILFCLFLLMLNGCNSNDTNTKQTKSRQKRDLTQKEEVQQEKPKSKEELLKEKLNDDQKKHLDWLKTALTGTGEFDKFLENDESKIKTALDHIKSELDKCTGDNANEQKTTFKQTVQGALSGGIDGFGSNNAVTTCGNGGS
ncbi:Mlp family lipoprotein [Borreliella burgdorferi]|uniref:Mlp family lipoprotein n=1 Tax=Borreliella burgdorferi TaxID=139 RepID=UPI001E3BDD02|nr:Mlp family lipoprotein [Borreliella burgdorferi]MCD2322302.1 Mlp family lipoprotein [Borreliella burgdorferi]MCD2372278.1 Mlp family lipoprotein [Borreliella burgdorferi]MCD2410256.1 Mlp family lipoprotein [Borreliella burgdorferi]MCD2416126.1 Mlp family lipoprotein [Borreliella burgdorferi]